MVTNENEIVIRGLRDVVAAETRISFVDPNGKLYYSGYNIDDLAGRVSYEEVVYLLFHNELPNKRELSDFRSELISEMGPLPNQVIKRLKSISPESHPMDVLRTEVSHLGEYDPDRNDDSEPANKRMAIRLVAKVPAIVSCLHRIRTNKPIVTPIEELGFAENFLYMFRGEIADKEEKDAIDCYMMLHADHGLNASAFAARVTASTRSDIYSAITSAIGTLKGPLHGGASERVMKMLDDINNMEEVEAYIQGMLDDKKRIMGFGHRVYKAEDPRSKHLRTISEILCHRINKLEFYEKCKKIEDTVHKKKGIYPNVDFYAASVMHALRVPKEFFTAFFASSRVAGWTAHVMEQYKDNVLIRPSSKYTGEYGREFVPIEKR